MEIGMPIFAPSANADQYEFVEEFRIDRRAAEAVLRAAGARFSDRNMERTAEEQGTA